MVLGAMLLMTVVSNTPLRDFYGAQLLPSIQSDQFLTMYLPLDGNILDPTQTIQTAQITGNPLSAQNCKVGGCLEFDGIDDFLDVGKTTQELGVFDGDFTMMAWINGKGFVSSSNNSTMNAIFGTDSSIVSAGLHLGVKNKKPYFGMFGNDTEGTTTLNSNTWVHLAFRYKKSTLEQTIYVNGVLDKKSENHGPFIGINNVKIGRALGGNPFKGLIDEPRVYNTALSANEIQEIVNLQLSPPSQPTTSGISITSDDVQYLEGLHYVRVKKGESGNQACERVGGENTLTGNCVQTSKNHDDQSPSNTACLAFHPGAPLHDASTQNTSNPTRSSFGTSSIGFCESSQSITCDENGSLRDPSSTTPLSNTCHTCTTCQPTTCETLPDSLGLDELYVECSFTDPNICTPEEKVGVYTLEQEIFEEFVGSKGLGVNNNQVEIDLIELIRSDLDPAETVPDDILVTKITIQQGNTSNIVFYLDGQRVAILTKPQGSFSVPFNTSSIRADRILIPPSNGMNISYIRERKTRIESPQTFNISNASLVSDLGAIQDFQNITPQTPQGAQTTYRLNDISGQIAIWIAPVSFEGTIPLSTKQTTKSLEHIFACKDSDADGVCDVTTCPDIQEQTGTLRQISVGHQTSSLQQLPQDLLIQDEGVQISSSCPTCSLSFDKDPSQFKGGQANSLKGFVIHVRSIDSLDGSVAHTLLLFGPVEQMDKLVQRNGKQRFQFITPSVLSMAQNDYAFQRIAPTGVVELIPVEGQLLESQLAKPLINGEQYPYLFLIQSTDDVWLVHTSNAHHWNINTLQSDLHTPAKIKNYFDVLPSAPTPEQCEQVLSQQPQAGELLENANSFQVFLDLLTLCNRL